MPIELMMPSNHPILCLPPGPDPHLLLLPSVFPSIRVFSNESVLGIRWPKYWSFSFSISPSSEYSGLISFRMDWFDLLEFLLLVGLLLALSPQVAALLARGVVDEGRTRILPGICRALFSDLGHVWGQIRAASLAPIQSLLCPCPGAVVLWAWVQSSWDTFSPITNGPLPWGSRSYWESPPYQGNRDLERLVPPRPWGWELRTTDSWFLSLSPSCVCVCVCVFSLLTYAGQVHVSDESQQLWIIT